MTATAPQRLRVVIELDGEALAALDRASRNDRLSRPAYARAALVRELRAAGHLSTIPAPEAAR